MALAAPHKHARSQGGSTAGPSHSRTFGDVRFSNRPFEVKHFQTIRHCSVDVVSRARASLRNRPQGRSIMGYEDEVEQSFARPCRCRSGGVVQRRRRAREWPTLDAVGHGVIGEIRI
jgi:hypothetical protein